MPRRTAKNSENSERGSNKEPRFLIVGRIRKPHGVRGDMKVAVQTDDPDRFYDLDRVFVSRNAEDMNPRELKVTSVRFHQPDAVLTFEGIETREAGLELNSNWLFVAFEDAIPLEDGELYNFQMLGLIAVTQSGRELGPITRILETGANDVLVIKGAAGEILIPDIPHIVVKVDLEAGQVVIEPIPGLIPEDE